MDIRHRFESTVPDGPDVQEVRPSNWNDTHKLNMTGPAIVGSPTALTAEAIDIIPSAAGDILHFDGTTIAWRPAGVALPPLHMTFDPGPVLWLTEDSDLATVEVLRIQGARATPAVSDRALIHFYLNNAAVAAAELGRFGIEANVLTAGAETGRFTWAVKNAGTMNTEMILTPTSLSPFVADG